MSKDHFTWEELRKIFVTYDIFNLRVSPLEKLGYGLVSMIVVAVVAALITLVVRR